MKLRISKTVLVWCIITGIILKPFSVGFILPLQIDKGWDYLRIAVAILLTMYYIRCKYEFIYLLEISGYQIFILVVTFILGGDVKTCLIYTIMYAELVMITFIGTYRKDVMYGMYIALSVICIFNFFTIVAFPKGLYINKIEWQNWYLGYRNVHIIYLLPCMVLSDLYYSANKKVFYKIIEIVCFVQPFLVWSAGAIVCVAVYEITKFLDQKFYLLSKWKIRIYLIVWVLINFLITKGYIIDTFRFLIVDILHRTMTLTGRINFWKNFWRASLDSLIWGHGNQYDINTAFYLGAPYAHNFLLNLLYVGGILAVIMFTYIFFIYSYRLKNVEYDKGRFRYVFAGLIAFMIMALTESIEDMGAFPIVIALLGSVYISGMNFSNLWRLDNVKDK